MSVDYRPWSNGRSRAGPSSSHDMHERSPPRHDRSGSARHPSKYPGNAHFPSPVLVPDDYGIAGALRRLRLDMLRATILPMNRELEVLIREVMIQMALRKQSWQGPDNPS